MRGATISVPWRAEAVRLSRLPCDELDVEQLPDAREPLPAAVWSLQEEEQGAVQGEGRESRRGHSCWCAESDDGDACCHGAGGRWGCG